MRNSLVILIIFSIFFTSGCLVDNNKKENELTISAAISLSDAMKEMGGSFQVSHPGVTIYFNFGASGTLMRQIEQGASVDIFASASQKEMNTLQEKGLINIPTRINFTKNRLVIIYPVPVSINDLATQDVERIAIGNPKTVPAGHYAKTFLENYGIYEKVEPKFIYAENVRQVLDYVELGEVDAGFVYLSDMENSDVNLLEIDSTLYPEIVYPVAVVRDSRNMETAVQFIEYIKSAEGQTILNKHGFG